MPSSSAQRRAAYAVSTRTAIVEAARTLFVEQGYFATTIEQVARAADVSPATVYAVAGGKQGLMQEIVQLWAGSPIIKDSLAQLQVLDDPRQILSLLAASSRAVREQYGDVMHILLTTAPHDPVVAESLASSTARYRGTMDRIAERLHQLGAVEASVAEVADVLWFYFGYAGYFTLIKDNQWSLDRAQAWLLRNCTQALALSSSA
jgi:AcrR family transcriptional regulator